MRKKPVILATFTKVSKGSWRLPRHIKSLWGNLPIRSKLFLYAAMLIALMVSLAWFAGQRVSVIQNRDIPARFAVREMEAALLSMRVNEQQFILEADTLNTELYLKHTSESLQAWEQEYRKFETNHGRLSALGTSKESASRLRDLQEQAQQYRNTFLELSSVYQERGFQTFGREGVLVARADMLQASLNNQPQEQLLLQRLKQAQNEFLLYKHSTAVSAFKERVNELRPLLRTAEQRTALEEYDHMFSEVVVLYEKIGLTAGDGLRGQLNKLMSQMLPRLQAVEEDVLSATSQRIASIPRSINIATIVLATLAVIMAIIIARFITRNIRQLLAASHNIMAGNLDHRIAATNTDELGQLAVSFDMMTRKLQENRHSLHSKAKALAQSVRRFELISRAVNEAVYERDIESGKLVWGEGLVSVFGYRPQDKETKIDWWTERIHSDDAQAIDVSLGERFRRKSQTWKHEYRFKKASGQYAYCQDRGFIEYHQGKPIRMVGSLVDITRQKELDRAKDEFISIASHQLRTPLGSIRWNLELLVDKANKLPKETAGYIQEAYKSTLRMLGLVGDLLSVARIEQNRVQDMPQETDLAEIIDLAIGEMRPLAQQNNIRIDSAGVKHGEARITIDPKRFREAVQNLLSNAVKYSRPNGEVRVAIDVRPNDIVITIADNGVGIPSEEQGNLFTKFFRAKNVLATDTEGSGLGLFVVKSYVEQWGGRIWLDSEVNKGTTFYISIPRKPRFRKLKSK